MQQSIVSPTPAMLQETAEDMTPEPIAGTEPPEEIATEAPQRTPWPEPSKTDYTGKYLAAALDKEPSRYPALKPGPTVFETTWASFRLPEAWAVQDAEGPEPVITDSKGRAVGSVFTMKCVPTEPNFALLPEGAVPIAWEKPNWPVEARVVTFESPAPTVAEGSRTTIIRMVCVIDGVDDDGTLLATCFSFDKAYVDGKVEYVLSNKAIDEIVQSYIEASKQK